MAATTVPALTEPTDAASAPRRPSSERFEVGRLIGRGGMGEVHLARDLRVDREVAIKSLRGCVRSGSPSRPEAVARFLREARVQARLDHPAIVPVYDVDVDEAGIPYFAMKCVTGVTLDVAIERRWPRRQLLARLVDVCLAIELAHTRGIVHRDLKPSNIMLGDFGEVYVLDWGIASLAELPDEPGAMLGTPGYMAPEQIEGGEVEARTDVFALGLLLYEILAAQPALPRGPDAFEPTLATRCHRPSAAAPDVPPELDDICARATANDVADRHASARAFADAIVAYLDGDRDVERRRELVDEHVHTARAALAHGADANAMREVGCALALDPTNQDALALVRKILVEPPGETPPAVIAKRETERLRATQIQLGIAQKIYACFLVLLPLALLTKLDVMGSMVMLGGVLVFAMAGSGYVRRRPHLIDRWMAIVLVLHCVMVGILGTICGPFQIVPIVGVISLAMFLNHPAMKRFGLVIAVHVVMVVIPLLLELLHVTPRTFAFDGKRLVVDLLAADIGPAGVMTAIVGTVWALSFVIAWLVIRQRRAQEHARDRLHLHSWRLAQLLPADAGRSIPPNRVSIDRVSSTGA